jgi:hypothetical protein
MNQRALEAGARVIPSPLDQCIDSFWADNDVLKREILRDLYATGRVSFLTTQHGLEAVDIWLRQNKRAAATTGENDASD